FGDRSSRHAPLDLAAGQRLGPDDQPGAAFGEARRAHRVLDAALPEDFHGAGVDAARFRRQRGAAMALDQERAYAVLREQQRGREPHRTAAGNQNGYFEHFCPSSWLVGKMGATASAVAFGETTSPGGS